MKKRIFLLVLLAVASFTLYSVFLRHGTGGQLKFYTWDSYVSPELFEKFENETGITVTATPYSSNDDMMKSLEAGVKYDLVTPSVEYVTLLVSKKMLQKLPQGMGVSMQARLSPPVRYALYDPEAKWSLPLFYGTTGVAVNTSLTDETVTSWKQLFERPAGEPPSIGMLDEKNTLSAVAALAAGTQHCDVSPETLAKVKTLFDAQKPFVKSYKGEGYYGRLAENDVKMQLAWSGDAFIARRKNPAIKYFYPAEGVDLWVDSLAIPVNAQNPKAALKFIEFVMRKDNMAQYAAASGNIPATADAMPLLPPEMRDAPEFNLPVMARMTFAGLCTTEEKAAFNTLLADILPAKTK